MSRTTREHAYVEVWQKFLRGEAENHSLYIAVVRATYLSARRLGESFHPKYGVLVSDVIANIVSIAFSRIASRTWNRPSALGSAFVASLE